jgi:ferric-dicitrate binding protein FerR (iron transport regulator)
MNIEEARQFVADFGTGRHTSGGHASFLRWLNEATSDEFEAIANEHESQLMDWYPAGLEPTAQWRSRLEERLNTLEEPLAGATSGNWFVRRRTWIAAASIVLVLAGGVAFYLQQGRVRQDAGRSRIPATAKTLVNPRGGGTKEIVLGDGSRVVLNVASVLTYPETFGPAARMVELAGEAYFEVAPDASKPFRVMIRDGQVEVLGTEFNIRAYADEQSGRTTLIQGQVEVKCGSAQEKLEAGQQAEIRYTSTGNAEAIRVSTVDANAVLAWRNGDFKCSDEDVYTVLKVISRYYNVEIEIDPGVPHKGFTGIVSRTNGLDQNLKLVVNGLGYHYSKNGNAYKITL